MHSEEYGRKGKYCHWDGVIVPRKRHVYGEVVLLRNVLRARLACTEML